MDMGPGKQHTFKSQGNIRGNINSERFYSPPPTMVTKYGFYRSPPLHSSYLGLSDRGTAGCVCVGVGITLLWDRANCKQTQFEDNVFVQRYTKANVTKVDFPFCFTWVN